MPTSEISYLVADGRMTNLDARMRKTSETFFSLQQAYNSRFLCLP